MPADIARAVRWLEAASLNMADLNETKAVRPALDALALRLDGKQAGANTIRRKRAVLHHVFEYAVELEELPSNPLHRIKWKLPKTTETVDPRVVVNPHQARELLVALTYVGKRQRDGKGRGRRLMGMFACMYFAALRPGEAVSLREQDCYLPANGWGRLTLDGSRPEVNRRWTDTGNAHELRGLKHRGEDDVRRIPIPPELVKILRQHIEEFGVAPDGRLFRSERGGVVASTAYTEVWQEDRTSPSRPLRSPRRSRGGRTTCGTRPSRSGSTAAYRLQRWPPGPATGWTSCSGSMPSASTARRRSSTSGSRTYSLHEITNGTTRRAPVSPGPFGVAGATSSRAYSGSWASTWGNVPGSIPRISRDHRQTAAHSGIRLHTPEMQKRPRRASELR
ncbi:tyrosine-type recombinase/integrase [Nonomuraea rhizosphaerae]|uniref:tyrosine-type recombinase/integrase n=1 Tax=Nonomuraea rhizosphaerae TaxID=2665663 RepID=UPI001FE61FDF|nr:hypothetical protein [Nonomuraea rhizosphaerae]